MTDLTPAPDAPVGVLDRTVVDLDVGTDASATTARAGELAARPAARVTWPASCGARRATHPGCGRPSSRCSSPRPSSTCGTSGRSGWANSFYSAAVQAGTKSWKAFFFGSSDSSNFITVDKPPAFLWPMEISARIFGLNSWSVLAPQALEGVATVGLVYLSVRRWFSAQAAILGGAVVALTPVAALMFRYNNPDAMLALLLAGALYATIRGLERAQTKWLVLAGALVGFGFITKMMQAFLILPVMAVVYLLAAPTGLRRRVVAGLPDGRVRPRRRRLVGRRGRPHTGGRPPVRRRVAGQQHLEPHLRLQRLRPDHRERDRQCGRRQGRRQHVGPDRAHPALQLRVRRT